MLSFGNRPNIFGQDCSCVVGVFDPEWVVLETANRHGKFPLPLTEGD